MGIEAFNFILFFPFPKYLFPKLQMHIMKTKTGFNKIFLPRGVKIIEICHFLQKFLILINLIYYNSIYLFNKNID